MGNGGCGQFITCCLCLAAAPSSSRGGLLTPFPCSGMGSLPQETVLHELLQCEFFPWAAILHNLLQCGSFPCGAVPSGTGCSSVGPPLRHKPCQQTCSGVGSSLHGSAGPGRSLLQHGAPHGITASFRHPSALVWGPFHRLQVEICSTMDLYGLQGHSLPYCGLHHRLQGRNLCSCAWSTAFPSFTDLGVCRLVFSHIVTLLSLHCHFTAGFYLLKHVLPEVLPPSLIGLALARSRSILEPAGISCIRHGGSFWQLLTEATHVDPSLRKSCHANPQQ